MHSEKADVFYVLTVRKASLFLTRNSTKYLAERIFSIENRNFKLWKMPK